MKHFLFCTMALVALVATVRADDEEKTESPAPDNYQSLLTEYSKAQRAMRTAFSAAKTVEEKNKLRAEYGQIPAKYSQRFLKFAEANADDPTAFDALSWVVSSGQSKDANKALPVIMAKHIDNPKIAQLCQRLSRSTLPGAKKFMRAVIDSSKNDDAKAYASYSLAKALLGRTGARNEEAEALLATVIEKYADVANGSLAKTATNDLYVAKNFSIGCVAPEITSEDIDGVVFNLTDYRGKVLVLDFWGNW